MNTIREIIHEIDDGTLPDASRHEALVVATGVIGSIGLVAAASPFFGSLEPSELAKSRGGPVLGCIPSLRLEDRALNARTACIGCTPSHNRVGDRALSSRSAREVRLPALCLANTVDKFLAPRVVTTLAVVGRGCVLSAVSAGG